MNWLCWLLMTVWKDRRRAIDVQFRTIEGGHFVEIAPQKERRLGGRAGALFALQLVLCDVGDLHSHHEVDPPMWRDGLRGFRTGPQASLAVVTEQANEGLGRRTDVEVFLAREHFDALVDQQAQEEWMASVVSAVATQAGRTAQSRYRGFHARNKKKSNKPGVPNTANCRRAWVLQPPLFTMSPVLHLYVGDEYIDYEHIFTPRRYRTTCLTFHHLNQKICSVMNSLTSRSIKYDWKIRLLRRRHFQSQASSQPT